ncbi:MAG TPA: hypothetical protein VLL98_03825, partial [Rickettsiales bacterium]|nr:hypothetical protein [Rickettsiales bacterium]
SIVSFDKLNNYISNKNNVPIIGDIMTSRWAYEAMMVSQFKKNAYNNIFYANDQKVSNLSFTINYEIPKTQQLIGDVIQIIKEKHTDVDLQFKTKLIEKEIVKLNKICLLNYSFTDLKVIENLRELNNDLSKLKIQLAKQVTQYLHEKDNLNDSLNLLYGSDYVFELKSKNYNTRLGEFVLKSNELNRIEITNDKYIRLFEPIYYEPESRIGRAHFFAPLKRLGFIRIDTFRFNIMIIWSLTLIMYFILCQNWFKQLVNLFERIKIN